MYACACDAVEIELKNDFKRNATFLSMFERQSVASNLKYENDFWFEIEEST